MEEIVQPRDVLQAARDAGARAAELLYTEDVGFEAVVDEGRIVRRAEMSDKTMAISVWLNEGQVGRSKGKAENWRNIVDSALKKAHKSEPNPYAGPAKGWATSEQGLGLDDLRYDQLTEEDKCQVILNAYRDTKDTSRTIDLSDFRYQDRRRRRILANTKGVLLQEYDTQYGTFGTVAAPRYDLMLSGGVEARTFSSVASMPYGILLAKRLSVLMGKEAKMNGPIRVFWPPRVTAQIFAFLAPFFYRRSFGFGPKFFGKRAQSRGILGPSYFAFR
jgi:hypothetical protein